MDAMRGRIRGVTLLRLLAIVSFVAGLTMLVVGFTRSGEDGNAAAPPFVEKIATPTPTPSLSPTPTSTSPATVEPTPTPTPTPPPYDGPVARLKIERLGVDAEVVEVGLRPDNRLEDPKDPHTVGWYSIYDKPGVPNPYNTGWSDFGVYTDAGYAGNVVFAGHRDYFPNIRGPFFRLLTLDLGDEVTVVMGDGTEYRYRVIRVQQYEAATAPMGDIIWPKDKPRDVEWVTLITCGGEFVQTSPSGAGEYRHRDIVVAERIQ
jgi:hypothetical protein